MAVVRKIQNTQIECLSVLIPPCHFYTPRLYRFLLLTTLVLCVGGMALTGPVSYEEPQQDQFTSTQDIYKYLRQLKLYNYLLRQRFSRPRYGLSLSLPLSLSLSLLLVYFCTYAFTFTDGRTQIIFNSIQFIGQLRALKGQQENCT